MPPAVENMMLQECLHCSSTHLEHRHHHLDQDYKSVGVGDNNIQFVITSVWKVQFQQFKYFSLANNELFHMVHLTQKKKFDSNFAIFCTRTMD